MKISTKGRYALRLMVDLAVHTEDGGYAPIRSIAERQELSDKYLEQLIAQLSRAGFVRSARGAPGGVPPLPRPGDLHGGGYPAPDGGRPCAGGLRGQLSQRPLLRPLRQLRHRGGLAAALGCHQSGGGRHHPGRPGAALS